VQNDEAQKALSLANVTHSVRAAVLAPLRYLIMSCPAQCRCAVMRIAGRTPLTDAAHTMRTRLRFHLQPRWCDVRDRDVGMGVLLRKLDTQGHTRGVWVSDHFGLFAEHLIAGFPNLRVTVCEQPGRRDQLVLRHRSASPA
jgi:hypothetical protein